MQNKTDEELVAEVNLIDIERDAGRLRLEELEAGAAERPDDLALRQRIGNLRAELEELRSRSKAAQVELETRKHRRQRQAVDAEAAASRAEAIRLAELQARRDSRLFILKAEFEEAKARYLAGKRLLDLDPEADWDYDHGQYQADLARLLEQASEFERTLHSGDGDEEHFRERTRLQIEEFKEEMVTDKS